MFYAVFAAALAVTAGLSFLYARKNGKERFDRIIKIFAVCYIVLSMLDVFLPDLFMCSHEPDALKGMAGKELHAVLRWLNLVCFTVLPIAIWQRNKYFERIASFFCLPVSILNAACFYQYIGYFTANSNSGLQTVRVIPQGFKDLLVNEAFRSVFFGLTCLCQLCALILLTYKNRKNLTVAKGELANFFMILMGVIWISLPIYVPQYLVGHVSLMMIRFSWVHIAWIVAIIAIVLALYYAFRNKSYDARYIMLLALSWALMMQFSQMFTASAELNIMKLPLQLCNLGSYLALIMLLTRNEKIYHFTLVVNVVGAILAIIILDIEKDISHISRLWVVHYVVEHTKVLVIPVLCLLLKIFKPIDLKSIKHFSIGFTGYFLFVLVLGTVSNGLYRLCEGEAIQNFFYANHLFMFDKVIAKRLLGFTDPLFENCVLRLGAFELYPLVQTLVYVVYMSLSIGVYFLIYALTKSKKTEKNR